MFGVCLALFPDGLFSVDDLNHRGSTAAGWRSSVRCPLRMARREFFGRFVKGHGGG
jgi:hypothetical protein